MAEQGLQFQRAEFAASARPSEVPRPRGAGRFSRALLFGFGAAVAGSILFAAVSLTTGYQFSLLSIVVGLMVGKAIKCATGGLGGVKYQVLAVLLTYGAITTSFVPQLLRDAGFGVKAVRKPANPAAAQPPQSSLAQNSPPQSSPPAAARAAAAPPPQPYAQRIETRAVPPPPVSAKPPEHGMARFQPVAPTPTPSLKREATAVMFLIGVGLISPFLFFASNPVRGALNALVILFGLLQAWRQARDSRVAGPA